MITLLKRYIPCCLLALSVATAASGNVTDLRCEYLRRPIGIESRYPRFTWCYSTGDRSTQSAYRLLVSSDSLDLAHNRADVWDSGWQQRSDMSATTDRTVVLESHKRYWWRVETLCTNGKRHQMSDMEYFETAKIDPDDWSAQWISDNFDREFRKSPVFRKSFMIDKPITAARLYVCGIGYCEMNINGKKAGDHLLDPGYTHFDKRVLYSTYDVTDMLQAGENVISSVLGNGWFNIQSLAVWEFHKARWRERPKMICELRITFADGSTATINSDSSWKSNTEAYISNSLYSGDVYDARLEKSGWREAGYDDADWTQAKTVEAPCSKLCSQNMPPIRAIRQIAPKNVTKFSDCLYLFDMGVNTSGVCRLSLNGERGTCVKISYGELVDNTGRLNQGNIDVYFQREKNGMPVHKDPFERFQTDVYFMKGGGEEEFTPSFTYHGFRYVEIESDRPIELSASSLTGVEIHTDVESIGSFECSDPTLNALYNACKRSYLSNLHSIPTDCPQREKNGWTADGYMAMDLGLLNYDGVKVYEKWLDDFVDNQRERGDLSGIVPSAGWGYADWIGPVWDAALFIVANNLCLYYGDRQAVERIYPTCKRYLDYLTTREKEGKLTYGIGDWVYYKAKTPTDYTSTAFYWLDNVMMAKFAALVGDDPQPYSHKADALKQTINSTWYNAQTGLYANGTQAAQAVALSLGFFPDGDDTKIAQQLVEMIRRNNHQLDFGMLGSKFVPAMLVRYGYADDAMQMVMQPNAPSWASWINRGLTTLPETWVLAEDFKDASLNHAFLGDIGAWLTNTVAGICYDSNSTGFEHFILHPHFIDSLGWAKGEYRSVKGLIESSWTRTGNKITLNITVPANTSATLILPDGSREVKGGKHSYTVEIKNHK